MGQYSLLQRPGLGSDRINLRKTSKAGLQHSLSCNSRASTEAACAKPNVVRPAFHPTL